MKVAIAAALLLAGTAIAAPSEALREKLKARRLERNQKRAEERANRRAGRSVPPLAVNYTSMGDRALFETGNKNVQYDSNWAGAAIVTTGVSEVTAQFNVPSPKEPSGGSSRTSYGAAAWVGIDGYSCDSAILQTGVEFVVEGTETAYSGWYEWYPDYSYSFSSFDVGAGDEVKATVIATSDTAGTATLENLTTGQTVTKTFTNQASVGSLCRKNAEWIVEDYEENGKLVPFANFGTVTFQDSSYKSSGATHGVTGATILDVKQGSTVETNCGLSGSSTVYCNYV